jgi:nitroreductase
MNDLFDIIHSTRAMRRLKPDPVPDELIRRMLEAAVAAPSASNRQAFRFIVVKDASVKAGIAGFYRQAFDEIVSPHYAASAPPPGVSDDAWARQHAAVGYLTAHFHEAPVWVVACLDAGPKPGYASGASVYPAVQNLLLAARALGLGATLTTRHTFHGRACDDLLGLPDGVWSYAIVPVGYPIGRFGPVRRQSIDDLVFYDSWGSAEP